MEPMLVLCNKVTRAVSSEFSVVYIIRSLALSNKSMRQEQWILISLQTVAKDSPKTCQNCTYYAKQSSFGDASIMFDDY